MTAIHRLLPLVLAAACTWQPPATVSSSSPASATSSSSGATLPPVSAERIAGHIANLASDAFLGRGPATAGETMSVEYIAGQFRAAGLEPGGANGSWFQEVPLLQTSITGTPDLSIAVSGRRMTLAQGEQIALRANMQNVDRVDIDAAPLVFIGYGVTAPERNWNDFKGQDLRGKVGVVLVNDPDFGADSGAFGGKAMTIYGRWTWKYEEAARQGLAGLLIVHETAPASYGWPTVKNSNTNTMFDIVRTDPAAVHTKAEAWIQRDVAVELFRSAGLDFEALKRQAATREFQPVPIGDATFSAHVNVRRQMIRSRNVLARLRGATHPNETILYGSHWDHLGVGAPDARGDSIYNGAVDNATGTAVVLELARTFAAGPRPDRSMVFAAWTVEEKGLLGSEYYAANPVYPLETTVAGFNVDALKPTGATRDVLVIGYGQSELEDRAERVLATSGRVIARDAHPEAGYFYRSDHFPLAKRGVPMLYFESGNDMLQGGTAAGIAADEDYNEHRYHQQADNYDPATWRLDGIVQDAMLLQRLGADLANSRDWPNYRATSEFRPIRDRSASARVP